MGKITVAIIGLGYGGISFLKNFKISDTIEIVAVDQNPFHYLQPSVYEYISNKKLLSEVIVDLFFLVRLINKNITFYKDKVLNIDFDKKQIITYKYKIYYDYLVISIGSQTFFPKINGLKKYSAGIKTVKRAMEFKQSFEKTILKKISEEEKGCINKDFNIIIGGGGLSGVEIATEMAVFQKRLLSSIGCSLGKPDIYIIEALPNILYNMDDFIIETATKRINNLGINLIVGKKLIKVEEDKILLEDGKEIKKDFLIWTGGIVGNNLIQKLNLPKNKRNQILVDEYLRVKGFDNVFAIGDCAEIRNWETGEILPATAQIAIQSGKIVANHIKNLIEKKPLNPIYPKMKAIIAALGGSYAVGVIDNKIKLKGYPAYLIKEAVLKSYRYLLTKKIF